MPKTRREEGGLGDWSSTGTFLRKPTTGWLHEDHELCSQSSINYKIWYLGCIEVCQSMRTLQYNMRTQVTKEAIVRMADGAGKLQQHRKKKVPKQLSRLLGAADTRWAGEVNLAVSAESLRISNAASNREIMNHSLPSISFASGGDGTTIDFIGYVAKDPVHERACHVFECVDCSQYVLTTIGQAFELRYKMYLNSPQPEPLQIRNSISTGDSWAVDSPYEQRGPETAEASGQGEPPSPYSPSPGAGIYSDLPEFPSDSLPSPSPSPSPSSSSPSLPSLTTVSGGRSRVYSQLPGFPTLHEDKVSPFNGSHKPRLDNPYDTIHSDTEKPQFTDSVYSEPGEITSSIEESYGSHIPPVRQAVTPMNSGLIDLTPPLQHPNHIYTNSSAGTHNGPMSASPPKLSGPPPKPRPLPRPQTVKQRVPSSPPVEAEYDDPTEQLPVARGRVQPDYDDPDALHMKPTRDGVYDDIQDVIGAKKNLRDRKPPPVVPHHSRRAGAEVKRVMSAPVYDDPNTIISANGVSRNSVPINQYEAPTEPRKSRSRTPKFDDTIYAIRRDVGLEEEEGGEEMDDGAAGNMSSPQPAPLDPLAPLPTQPYFHGVISRVEAEALVETEGEFLVRESSKIPGQLVLTGKSHDGPQHLLLMDKSGRVKSRDHQFNSVPHLVDYFTSRDIPLVIGKSQVFLRRAIINAFPGNRAAK